MKTINNTGYSVAGVLNKWLVITYHFRFMNEEFMKIRHHSRASYKASSQINLPGQLIRIPEANNHSQIERNVAVTIS